eukprot:403330806
MRGGIIRAVYLTIFQTILIVNINLDNQVNAVVFNPNCFDYTVTSYQSQVDDNFGITTMMKLKPYSLCEYFVYTGISRAIYPQSDLNVVQYRQNSLGNWVSLGNVKSGNTLNWYGFNGQAERRRFIVNNPTKYGVSFRINVQRYTGFNKSGVINQFINFALIGAISFGVLLGSYLM